MKSSIATLVFLRWSAAALVGRMLPQPEVARVDRRRVMLDGASSAALAGTGAIRRPPTGAMGDFTYGGNGAESAIYGSLTKRS